MNLIEFLCGKTPPRNHTISTKGMLLCWLDVKRPCVPKSGGKLWADHSEQSEWADQSEQTKAPHALWWRASWQHTLAPFCCLMFLAPQFPFSRKPWFFNWACLQVKAPLVDYSSCYLKEWAYNPSENVSPALTLTNIFILWLVGNTNIQVILIVGSTSAALTTLGSFPVPCSLHPWLFISDYKWFAALGAPLSPNQSIS